MAGVEGVRAWLSTSASRHPDSRRPALFQPPLPPCLALIMDEPIVILKRQRQDGPFSQKKFFKKTAKGKVLKSE